MSYRRLTLPKGIKFQPTDEELLNYLHEKNQGTDSDIIPEIESGHEPRDLPALVLTRADFFKEWFKMPDSPAVEYWHFFSRRNFMHSNCKTKSKSTKINRTTKEGSWKKQGDDRRITEACSDKQIGGKRILTFYLRGKQKTEWVIHEYYPTKADSDEQIGDFVVCRLQDNSSKKKKSGKSDHDRQDAPLHDGGGDQASIELGDVVVSPNGNDDAADHGGSTCNVALNVEDSASKPLEDVLPMPYGDHDDTEHGGGSCHFGSGMLTEAEEYSVFKMLQDVLLESDGNDQELRGSQTGPCYIDKSDLLASVEGQTDGYNLPDGMVEELLHEPGNLGDVVVSPNGNDDAADHGGSRCSMALNVEDSASKPLEDVLPMPCGDHDDTEHGGGSSYFASGMLTEAEDNLVIELLRDALFGSNGNEQELGGSHTGSWSTDKSDLSGQTDGYNSPDTEMVEELHHEPGDMALPHPSPSPEVLQSPIYECRKRKSPFGDTDPVLTKKNHTDEVDSNTSSDSENQAADAIPEGYSQLGGNLGSASFWSFILQSINREPRDLPQDNRYIDWGDLPSIIEGFESFLGNSDTFIDGGTSDRNTEVAYGSVGEDAEALCCCLFW